MEQVIVNNIREFLKTPATTNNTSVQSRQNFETLLTACTYNIDSSKGIANSIRESLGVTKHQIFKKRTRDKDASQYDSPPRKKRIPIFQAKQQQCVNDFATLKNHPMLILTLVLSSL